MMFVMVGKDRSDAYKNIFVYKLVRETGWMWWLQL